MNSEAGAVYLVLTHAGLQQALFRVLPHDSIWCASEAIPETEFRANPPPRVTRLAYSPVDEESVQRALWTIADHHPGTTVWVEAVHVKHP